MTEMATVKAELPAPQRAKINSGSGGAPTLATCWIGADDRAWIVVKIDDGEP